MSTDHACRTAADQAAVALAPVREALAPQPDNSLESGYRPSGLRAYLGTAERPDIVSEPRALPPVSRAIGARVLCAFLDGLLDDRPGALSRWHGDLVAGIRDSLGIPRRPGEPIREPGEWEAIVDLQQKARTLIGVFADHPRHRGPEELAARLAVAEDLFVGALRRLSVPPVTAADAAATAAGAAGSLFGVLRPTALGGPTPAQPS